MTNRNLLETVQLVLLSVLMFVAAAVAERRLARLVEAPRSLAGRSAPA